VTSDTLARNAIRSCIRLFYLPRFLASSGRSLEDGLAECRKCTLLKKETVAVCEVCGTPLCGKHAYQEGGWLCEDHISDKLREETKGTGLFSRFKLGHG
jgi:hypothetical protein